MLHCIEQLQPSSAGMYEHGGLRTCTFTYTCAAWEAGILQYRKGTNRSRLTIGLDI